MYSALKTLANFIYIQLLINAQLKCVIKVVRKKESSSNRFSNAHNFVLSSAGKGHSVDSLVPLNAVMRTETKSLL